MKLEGLRVLDLSMFLPGPHFTMMMADHGAEVISLEPPGGEPTRQVGLKQDDHTVWFRNIFRGKKSINLNLKSPEGKQAFFELIKTIDVIVEAFRPGVVERLGISYEQVRQVNPRIVYCSISAYGQTGTKVQKPAHDLSIQADSGALFINEGKDGQPAQPGMPVADMAGSLMAFSGVLMALYRRHETGQGDYLDISMQDSLVAWYANVMGSPFAENRSPEPKQERSWGGAAMYNIYKTADSKFLTLGGSELKFATNLLTALNKKELIELCKQPPGEAQAPVRAFFIETFRSESLAYWTKFLNSIDVCWAPVRTLNEAMKEPHLTEREMVVTDEDGNHHLGVPIKYQQEPAIMNTNLPAFSEHTEQILLELGYNEQEIIEMKNNKAILKS